MHFLAHERPHDTIGNPGTAMASITPHDYWEMFADCPLYRFGKAYTLLPASTAPLERVFSGATFVAAKRRGGLSPKNLMREVYVRYNLKMLDHPKDTEDLSPSSSDTE